AMNYKVKVYRLDTINSCFKDAIKTLASPNALRTGGGPHDSPYIINAIKVDKLLNEEVLVSVAENGEICIWRTEHLDEPPMIFNNNGVSTWGIALHSEQGLLAVSANNFKITVYNMLELTKEKPVFGAASIAVKYWLKDTDKIEFEGHNHNIPNIDFNATGRYIASASIDSTCKVWDLYRRQLVSSTKV
ncbi:WD40-repeat-containing domain protein, partial [Mycotypha africana]|uniref:WD40-repeat-containing domain protein n=1 Tax=Mycotypha africana TaxID=64632 RepID=UPI002300A99A